MFNATYDRQEGQWKAGEFAALKANGPYFQAVFRSRLAGRLQGLGYELHRSAMGDFEITGIPERANREFSRRTAQIEKLAEQLGIMKPESKAKLGATSRDKKVKGLTWEELLYLWGDRVTPDEQRAIRGTVTAAREPVTVEDRSRESVDWALRHLLERNSVVPQRQVVTEALRHGVGSVTPEGIYAELGSRKDLIRRKVKGVEMVSTQGVLAEERRVLDFAVRGRGKYRPLATRRTGLAHYADFNGTNLATASAFGQADKERGQAAASPLSTKSLQDSKIHSSDALLHNRLHADGVDPNSQARVSDLATLSPSQQAAIRHVWTSPDRLILIRGAAGTGKTTLTKAALAGVNVPWVILAPSAEASRGVLRRDGFENADTLSRFLVDEEMQQKVRGGLIWLDEASLAGGHDVARLTQLADSLNSRVVLSGDRRQHRSVARGDVLALLEDKAGLPVAEVSEIKRQSGEYRAAVQLLAKGDVSEGFAKLDDLGWVKEAGHDQLAEDYLAAVRADKSVLVVSPTHAEGEKVTAAIREKLKQDGRLKGEERAFERLVPLHLTEAEKSDPDLLPDGAVAQYVRAAPGVKVGQRVRVDRDTVQDVARSGNRLALFHQDNLRLAAGDSVRITANGKSLDGHRLNNGATYTVSSFTPTGDIRLNNGWLLSKDFGHIAHGYVATSHASQGKTVDVALIAMGNQSLGAMGSEQFYVSASRARQQTKVYVEDKQAVLDAIQRDDSRMLASDLVRQPRTGLRARLKKHIGFLRRVASLGRDREHTLQPTMENHYERY